MRRMALLLLGCGAMLFVSCSDQRDRKPSVAFLRFRDCMVGLNNYRNTQGVYPVDERGAEYALYKLREYTGQECFARNGGSRWDDESETVVGVEYVYANMPMNAQGPARVVLVGIDTTNEGLLFVGFTDDTIRMIAGVVDGGELIGRTEVEVFGDSEDR